MLTSTPEPVYNIEKYSQQTILVFSKLHSSVREKLKATKAEMAINQHKRSTPVNIKQGDYVMIQHPGSPKFIGPYREVRFVHGNKFEVMEPDIPNATYKCPLRRGQGISPVPSLSPSTSFSNSVPPL